MKVLFKFLFIPALILLALTASSQKQKISVKDSADGAFDLSSYIIDANGFIPIPLIITEPALGGFGGLIVPVFLKKRPPYIDTIKGKVEYTPVSPDVFGGTLGYTLNKTWLAAAFRSGTIIKSRIKYRIGGSFSNVNISYFRDLPTGKEQEFAFNIQSYALLLQGIKRIGHSYWYAGGKYRLSQNKVAFKGSDSLPSFVPEKDKTGVISSLGAIIELDNRDNIFTPGKGMKLHADASVSDNVIGSDYDFWRIEYYLFLYHPVVKNVTAGIRIDGQQSTGDIPFYQLPYIELRGVPACRYQGRATILTEVEFRYDFYKRWSLMGFSGAGKAFDEWKNFGTSNTVWTYGSGFRYLLARKFGLRAGIDIAKGPEKWAYYIVFGNNWVR